MPEDPYEKAIRYFYLLRQSIIPTPNQPSGWRCVTLVRRSGPLVQKRREETEYLFMNYMNYVPKRSEQQIF